MFFFSPRTKKKSTAGVGLWQPWQATRVSGRRQRREAGGVPTLAPVRSQRRPQKTPNKEFWRRSADPCKREHLQAEKIKREKQRKHGQKEKEYVGFRRVGATIKATRPLCKMAKSPARVLGITLSSRDVAKKSRWFKQVCRRGKQQERVVTNQQS